MAMVPSWALSAQQAQIVLPSLPPVVLYVSVSNAVAQTLASVGVPPDATGQSWLALRENRDEAVNRATWFETGAAAPDAVMLEVHISPAGWEQLVRHRKLWPAPVEGSWRLNCSLPAVMTDDQGQVLMHCNIEG